MAMRPGLDGHPPRTFRFFLLLFFALDDILLCITPSWERPMNRTDTQKAIESGQTALGVELGSTRIKAVLIGADHAPIASGSYEWENQYENGVWTYRLDDVWAGLQESYRQLSAEVFEMYGLPLTTTGAMGFSAMMHGYLV